MVGQNAIRAVGFQPVIRLADSGAGFAESRIQGVGGDLGLMTQAFISSGGANPGAGLIVLKNGSGNVGIGTTTPGARLHVVGTVNATAGVVIGNNPGTQDAPIFSDNAASSRVVLWNTATSGLMDLLCRRGDVSSLTIRGGADIAEPFPMKEETIEKGSVVVIDDEHPGRLKRSTRAYDTRVAGVVSGANGINPGIALKQEGALDQGENIALTGRVYVQADASSGAITPGDLLTTSDTPGHAMKVSELPPIFKPRDAENK